MFGEGEGSHLAEERRKNPSPHLVRLDYLSPLEGNRETVDSHEERSDKQDKISRIQGNCEINPLKLQF